MKTSINLIVARILATAAKRKASDVHLIAGSPPILRIDNKLSELKEEEIITKEFIAEFAGFILNAKQKEVLEKERELSVVFVFEGKVRMKINLYYQKGTLVMSLKLISLRIPAITELGLPKSLEQVVEAERGLIFICGPFGAGRTTTAAALIEEINKKRGENIITIEKPIEYIFTNNKSIILQREVGRDVNSFADALAYCKQEDVDIILIGENNEKETAGLIVDLVTAGRLIFYIVNSASTTQTIENFLAQFAPAAQHSVRQFLAESLVAIISQRLVPQIGGGRALALEILTNTLAVKSLIRDGKIYQLQSIVQTSRHEGMISLDQSLADLVKRGIVTEEEAAGEAVDKHNFYELINS